jgi:hypothetical protein
LDAAEIQTLAAAGLMLPDPFRMLLDSDPMSRVETSDIRARHRVQHTDFMVPPGELDELLSGSRKPVGIRSTSYLATEKSLAELMVAVRGARKVMDAFRRGYEEQHALLNELLRLVQERMMTARVQRHSVPAYLLEFARLMESIGCKRNDLRYLDGRVVRAIREALKGDSDEAEFDAEAEAARFQGWLAEGDITSLETEFERLSRSAATALMNGDLDAARAAFTALEMHKPTSQGASKSPADGEPKGVETGGHGVEQWTGSGAAAAGSAGNFGSGSKPFCPVPTGFDGGLQVLKAPELLPYGRVTGTGRLPGGDPFGGVLSFAKAGSDCVPMWDRRDRPMSAVDSLTMDDWYRFEVPLGPYALVHMPKMLTDYAPVRNQMFPPFARLERYGEVAALAPPEMRSLKLAEMGRGSMESTGSGCIDTAILAVRSVLIERYGKDNEELLRFWMFLLLGRRYMDRIDSLFPNGYFHGVQAPDPAALDTGIGSFQLIRVPDNGQ